MPDSSVEVFHERVNDIMSTMQRENKTCYLLGDLNIDFLKSDGHKPTSDFLDTIYSHNLFPLITKPNRVTIHSATLIDHIITNDFEKFPHISKEFYVHHFLTIVLYSMSPVRIV